MSATPTQFFVSADNTGLWHPQQTAEAARTVTRLLQADLERHHVFFNDMGFHNHISHQLFSLYGTGASPAALQAAYDYNTGYQRPAMALHQEKSVSRADTDTEGNDWYATTGRSRLGRGAYYPDFLHFFQQEMAATAESGGDWCGVVARRLLSGTPAADDLLVRLCAGFVHPLIQLQYGLEWAQPVAVAQGLAQACVHGREKLDAFLLPAERAAEDEKRNTKETKEKSILDLYREVAASSVLREVGRSPEPSRLTGDALDAMLAVAAHVHVKPTAAEVAERTAEMAEASVYVATAAALHPGKQPTYDFFLIHHITSIPFFLVLNQFDWVPTATKARLLEWKIRLDLVQYAIRACPSLPDPPRLAATLLARSSFSPVSSDSSVSSAALPSPPDVSPAAVAAAARLASFGEDGHAIKLVRGTALAEQALRPYADAPWRLLGDPRLWEQIYRLQVDSVMGPGKEWVRSAGLEEEWADVPDEAKL